MIRRPFMGRVAALWGLTFAPPRRIDLQRSPLAGFHSHAGARPWPRRAVGHALERVREPGNTHHPRAVRVDWQGTKIGYVRRVELTLWLEVPPIGAALPGERIL